MSHPSLKQKYPMPWDTSAKVLRKLPGGSLSWGALFTPLIFCHMSLVIMPPVHRMKKLRNTVLPVKVST